MEQYDIDLNQNQINDMAALAKYGVVLNSGTVRSGFSFDECLFIHLRLMKYPGIRQFIGRKTLKSLKITTFLKYQEILTNFLHYREGREYVVRRSSSPEIEYQNGSTVIFGDLEINSIEKWKSFEVSDVAIDEIQEVARTCFEIICTRQTQKIIQDSNLCDVDIVKKNGFYLINDNRTKQIKAGGFYLDEISLKEFRERGLQEDEFVKTDEGFLLNTKEKTKHIKISTQNNKTFLGCNPPEEAHLHWLHKAFRNPVTKIKNSTIVYGHLKYNKKNIPAGYIKQMYDRLDKRSAERLMEGKWVPQNSHIVFEDYKFPQTDTGEYKVGGNLKRFDFKPEFESTFSMDFGWTHEMVIALWQYDRNNDIHYRYMEFVGNKVKPEDYCKLLAGLPLKYKGKTYQFPISAKSAKIVVGGEANQSRQESSGISNIDHIRKGLEKYNITPVIKVSAPYILNSISRVRSYILTASGKRKLFVHIDNCKRFIQDASIYHFKTDKEGNVIGELPDKDDVTDHTQDETRYYIHYKTPLKSNQIYSEGR